MRVISMVPSWTETLVECGVNVVGRTRFCIHPESKVSGIPVVGGTKDIAWSRVKDLKPDLILLDEEENPKFMYEDSSFPVYATRVHSIVDLPREMGELSVRLSNAELSQLSHRWAQVNLKGRSENSDWEIPGVLEWWRRPTSRSKQFIYVIWKDPWMAVSKDTFIGSVFELLGYGERLVDFPERYPRFDVSNLDFESTVLLFSTEPFRFSKFRDELMQLPFPMGLVSGEAYSWFGLRSLRFLESQLS